MVSEDKASEPTESILPTPQISELAQHLGSPVKTTAPPSDLKNLAALLTRRRGPISKGQTRVYSDSIL